MNNSLCYRRRWWRRVGIGGRIAVFRVDVILDGSRIDGDRLGAIVRLVDANEAIGQLEHVRPQRNDDELGVAGALFDVVADDGHVLEIQSGVDLVHDVQRRRFVIMQGEDQGQRRERLLTARQVGYVLPRLLGRPDAEDDALTERVQRVDQLQLGVTAQRDHLVELFQLGGDERETGHELGETRFTQRVHVLALLVALFGHLVQVADASQVNFFLLTVLVDGLVHNKQTSKRYSSSIQSEGSAALPVDTCS